jgi:hypothetical protein
MADGLGGTCDSLVVYYEIASSYRCRLQVESDSAVVELTHTSIPPHHRVGEIDRVPEHGRLGEDLVGLRI